MVFEEKKGEEMENGYVSLRFEVGLDMLEDGKGEERERISLNYAHDSLSVSVFGWLICGMESSKKRQRSWATTTMIVSFLHLVGIQVISTAYQKGHHRLLPKHGFPSDAPPSIPGRVLPQTPLHPVSFLFRLCQNTLTQIS